MNKFFFPQTLTLQPIAGVTGKRLLVPITIALAFMLLACSFLIVPAQAADETTVETPLETNIVSLGLFKNGLVVVKRTATISKSGVYRVEDVPKPVHGTYWVESDAKITTRMTHRTVDVLATESTGGNFQQELAGKAVVVHFADAKLPSVAGTVLATKPLEGDAAWSRSYQPPRNSLYNYPASRQFGTSHMLVLQTKLGRTYIDSSRIAMLQTVGTGKTIRKRKPVMLFTVENAEQKPTTVSISYLAKGIAWAPSYRVDASDEKMLVLTQKAVVKNELGMVKNAEFHLISGFPSMKYSNVTSPLSLENSWASFFQQLNSRPSRPTSSMAQQSYNVVVPFSSDADNSFDLGEIPKGDAVDLHYQSIGKQTLAEGDSLAMQTATATAEYERIVEWKIPNTRNSDGRFNSNSNYGQTRGEDKTQGEVWDTLRFRNPFKFPMTTGAAMVVEHGRFKGQQLSTWANSGERASLRVTKALSIRTISTEREAKQEPNDQAQRAAPRPSNIAANNPTIVTINHNRYRRVTIDGTLRINNLRSKPISMHIERRFSGDLVSADHSPAERLLNPGDTSINKRNALRWRLELKAGEEVKLSFRYKVLIRF